MPLCPQITNTPITVSLTGDFTVTSVLPTGKNKTFYQTTAPTGGMLEGDLWVDTDDKNKLYRFTNGAWVSVQDGAISDAAAAAAAAEATANAAAAAAGAAQTAAAAALAEATDAYNAAIGSLQPSASTIVNASNQMTAINSGGITVYSGSSATSGPRVVMNSLGLAAYTRVNVSNAVGNGTTVTYTAGGHSFGVGTTVTITELAPSGYNGTFVITAVVAGSTFTVSNSTTATLTDSNGFAEASTLAISASTGNAVFAGSITGSTIIGGTLNIAGKATINSAGLLTATDATITGDIRATAGYFGTASNGFSINSTGMIGVGGGIISGGLIQTSSSTAVKLVGSTNSLSFMNSGTYVGHILNLSSSGILMHLGATANSTAGASYPYQYLSSGTVFLASNSTTSISLSSTIGYRASLHDFYGNLTTNSTGSITASGELYAAGHQTTGNAANGYVFQTGGRIARFSSSSERYKENIVDLRDVPELDPRKILDLKVRAFSYKETYLKNDDRTGVLIPGLIAEEVDAIYPLAVDYDNGEVENINDRAILINLLALVQDLYKEIQTLKGE
jgi:hypothetical protein